MTTTERTIERPRVERPDTAHTTGRSLIAPLAVVAALIAGALLGFLLWGTGDDSPTAVATNGDDLTARQEEMVDLVQDYEAAWQQGDREALTAMFTEDGVLTIWGSEFRGERLVDGFSTRSTLDVLEPYVIDGSRMLNFHTVSGFGTMIDVIDFTEEGEVLIVSHEIQR